MSRRECLSIRASLISAIRRFFDASGFLEVETPLRIPAPLPEAHIDAVPADGWFLHTSPESCMKQMLAAGYPKIYQICRCFRKGERGSRHLPEFTLLEWYFAGGGYMEMMEECEALILSIADALGQGEILHYQGQKIRLNAPWPRMTVREAFLQYTDTTADAAMVAGDFDQRIGLEIEPNLGLRQPLFLYDYPAEAGALARKKPDDPSVAERFELYIAGLEICNAFTELTDPAEQEIRFRKEAEARNRRGRKSYPWPDRFLTALSRMPPSTGNALGIDRLVMLFAGTAAIDDVVAFTPEEL